MDIHGENNVGKNENNDTGPYRRRGSDRPSPPVAGEIWEGTIERIQPYGAFCSFGPASSAGQRQHQHQQQHQQRQRQRRTWQGLIHISQLSESRVAKVEDVVGVDDRVWVKVLEVERQEKNWTGNNERTKHSESNNYRVKLSMKDVSQDGTAHDLGLQREARENAKTQLETNLNSMIGMGVARDPMERLILKGSSNSSNHNHNSNNNNSTSKTTFRGGYTLVDDDEGEPEPMQPDPLVSVAGHRNGDATYRTAPMGLGRGRGATLPAWMTSSEGPVGLERNSRKNESSRDNSGLDDERVDEKYQNHSDSDHHSKRQRSSHKKKKKKDSQRHGRKKRHRSGQNRSSHDSSSHDSDDDNDDNDNDNDSDSSRRDDNGRRRRKKHRKSSSGSHYRSKEHRKHSRKKGDKKSRKRSRRRDEYEKDLCDGDSDSDSDHYRRSKSRRHGDEKRSRGSSV